VGERKSAAAPETDHVRLTRLIVAPVAFHRVLFRRGQRPWIVTNANRAARAGLIALLGALNVSVPPTRLAVISLVDKGF
jgi:hypothetical protein